MSFDQGFRYAREGLDDILRAIAGDVSGDGDESDSEEDYQASALQIIASGDERKHIQAAANDGADGRKMIQQKMGVCQVHGDSVKDPVEEDRGDAARLLYHLSSQARTGIPVPRNAGVKAAI